jgi:hypothetical protein
MAWSLLHAQEHMAIHVGHIQIMRQMWDQSPTTVLNLSASPL